MLHSPIAQISTAYAAAVTVWSLAAGKAPERAAAAAIAVNWAGSILLQDHRPAHHLQVATFWLDGAQAAVLLGLVVIYRRTWTIWAAAFGLLLVLTHVTVMLDERFSQWSYLTASYIWSCGLVTALAFGTALEASRPAVRLTWTR